MRSDTGKRCWNCRQRKIACDKALPSCNRCVERGQICKGYGLKLSWPPDSNARRSAKGEGHFLLPVRSRDFKYVNTTTKDIDVFQGVLPVAALRIPSSLNFVSANLAEIDPYLSIHGTSPVARIVATTCGDIFQLYRLLVRMSLTDDSAPSLAARHAISALSNQHLQRNEAAVWHQTKALSALQEAIEGPVETNKALQMMAASLLLNIFETTNHEGSSMSWAIFMCGCKRIAHRIHQPNSTYDGDAALIMDWVFYHDVLYKFSIRHWDHRDQDQVLLAADPKIISKAVFSPLRQEALPSLGCSLEMLDVFSRIIDVVLDRHDPQYLSPEHLKDIRSLELRLDRLEQRGKDELEEQPDGTFRAMPSCMLPEMYRLAAYIYLERMGRGLTGVTEKLSQLVDAAYRALNELEACERPLPLFIVALEARSDEQRVAILDMVEKTLQKRPLGNVRLVERMIKSAWVQQDLCEDGEVDQLAIFNAVVSAYRLPPSFT